MFRAIAIAGLAASFAASAADIQKCADASGRVTYQDTPCTRGSAIGAVPRESAQGDPAAIRQLERDKARLERAADARIAAEAQQQAAPVIVLQPGNAGTAQPGVSTYTGPVNVVDPTTGAVIAQGTNAVIDPNTGTVLSLGTGAAPQVLQPSTATQPSAITQPPAAAPSSITQVPSASQPNTQVPGTNTQVSGSSTPLSVTPSQPITPSPAAVQAPAAGARR